MVLLLFRVFVTPGENPEVGGGDNFLGSYLSLHQANACQPVFWPAGRPADRPAGGPVSVSKLELDDLCNIIISIVMISIILVIIIVIILCGNSLGRGPGRAVTTLGSILRFEVITEEVRSEKGCALSLIPGKHV